MNFFSRLATPRIVTIPDDVWHQSCALLPFVQRRSQEELARLHALAGQLLGTKEMSAAAGLELTAAMQINIALQACLPILNLGIDWYRGWTGIVVYPGEFLVRREDVDEAGVVHEFEEPISGEAWDGGPLLLSWEDVHMGRDDGRPYNVVIHEFAHKIDMLNGRANGVPPFDRRLHPLLTPRVWTQTMDDVRHRLDAELELIEAALPAGIDPDDEAADPYYVHLPIDPYAAQNEAEFFAVSSEAFFVAPEALRTAYPDWYALLVAFYRQDPASA